MRQAANLRQGGSGAGGGYEGEVRRDTCRMGKSAAPKCVSFDIIREKEISMRHILLSTLALAIQLSALGDTMSEWHAKLSKHTTPTRVYIGEEEIDLDECVSPHVCATPGVTLVKASSGWKIKLSGAQILGTGIQANGDIAIELASGFENDIEVTSEADDIGLIGWNPCSYGINATHNLLIYGTGALTINNFVADGIGVMVGRNGWTSGSLSICGGCSLRVTTAGGNAINVDNGGTLEVEYAAVTLTGTGCGFFGSDGFTAEKSVINVLTKDVGLHSYGNIALRYVYGTFVSKGSCGISSSEKNGTVDIENSVVNVFTKSYCCMAGNECHLGTGVYQLAASGGEGSAAIYAQSGICIDGAKIECCVPNGAGAYSYEKEFCMQAGYLKMLSSMNLEEAFLFNEVAADYCGLLASWKDSFNPRSALENTLSHAVIDYIRSAGISNPSGEAEYIAQGGDYRSILNMEGGTILSDNTRKGICFYSVDVSGGSMKGPVVPTPTHGGITLQCITNKVAGGWSEALITGGWTVSLPSYYKTESLYADKDVNLYFWIQQTDGGGSEQDAPEEDSGTGETGWNLAVHEIKTFKENAAGGKVPCTTFSDQDYIWVYIDLRSYKDGVLTSFPGTVKVRASYDTDEMETFNVTGIENGKLCWYSRIGPLKIVGNRSLCLSLQCSDLTEESNLSDNKSTVYFTVASTKNDLVFDSDLVTCKAKNGATKQQFGEGDEVWASLRFRNKTGNTVSNAVVCTFTLRSEGKELCSFDKEYVLHGDAVARDCVRLDDLVDLPMGAYELTCRLDATDVCKETDESNNEQTCTFSIGGFSDVTPEGFFNPTVAHEYSGVLLKNGAVAGVISFKTKARDKKYNVKITGTLTDAAGKKHAAKGSANCFSMSYSWTDLPLNIKGYGDFTVRVGRDSSFRGALGSSAMAASDLVLQSATVGGTWTAGDSKVRLSSSDVSAIPGTVQTQLLPTAEPVLVKNGKWAFNKAAVVKWARDKTTKEYGLIVDTGKDGSKSNLSGLKLTYAPKAGTFKGSYKLYSLVESRGKTSLKKYTVNVNGFVIDGVGYGTATLKKPAASWSLTVK